MFSTEREVEAYVRLLHSELDTTTVTAALTLLISEVRAASEKQRRLIALERLTAAQQYRQPGRTAGAREGEDQLEHRPAARDRR